MLGDQAMTTSTIAAGKIARHRYMKTFYPDQMRLPVRYCKDKVIYDKKGAATAKNKRMIDEHVRLRIYACPDCHGWHLTHKRVKK